MAEEKEVQTQVPDTEEQETSSKEVYSPSEDEQKIIEKWKNRFTRADNFLRPYRDKWLRMYKLYRAYQERANYAYDTRLMPPIAFEIVETVVSRMATARRKVRILPRAKDDVESPSLDSWKDLVNYDFDIIKLRKRMRDWVKSSSLYGNGIGKVTWFSDGEDDGYDDPMLDIIDLWEILPAPETIDLQEDCPWLIHRIVKNKSQIEREEKARGEEGKLYKNLEFVEPKQIEDWKKERYEINTKKMGQIQGVERRETEGATIKVTGDKYEREKQVEIWECWDFEEQKIVTLMQREVLTRDDDSPYKAVNGGRIFIDLPDHDLNWELWAVGHIEPVETTIVEVADLRNQRMDDVILMLDPVVKIRKDSGISKNDIVFAPGAKWELRKMDDVVIERPPEVSLMGVNEDKIMREEIERTLALSEYVQGMPKSSQEPLGKVEMLIGQSNLRLGSFAENIAMALTQLANNLIQLNEEFITESKFYRVVGDEDVSFKEFKEEDKKIKVDALVEIDPVLPKDPQTRLNEALLLYDRFVGQDKPEDPEEIGQWKKRKRALQKMILEAMGLEAYEAVLIGKEEKPAKPKPEEPTEPEAPDAPTPTGAEGSPAPPPRQSFLRRALNALPLIGGGRNINQ